MSRQPQGRALVAVFLAFSLGSAATVLVSGCQKADTPANTPDVDAPMIDKGSVTEQGSTPDVTPTTPITPAASQEPENQSKLPVTEGASAPAEPSTSPEPSTRPGDPAAPTKDSPENEPKNEPTASIAPAAGALAAGTAAAAATNAKEQLTSNKPAASPSGEGPGSPPVDKAANPEIKPGDWPMWGGTPFRNNVPIAEHIPIEWAPGDFDSKTGDWKKDSAVNIKWVSQLGSQSYGNPVVAHGQVYVGSNNNHGYLKRYPADVDLGTLLCFSEADGKFLWQHSSEKLPTGRVHDWPQQGICCAPLVEGDRLWFVTSRGEVRCLDTQGFYDGEDDGPVTKDRAKLFEVAKNENPEQDEVAGIVAGLNDGKVSEALKGKFSAAGVDLAGEASVKVGEAGKSWTVQAKVGESDRDFPISIQGPRLVASKIIGPDDKDEADVVWVFDMMKELGVSQHNMCSCSVTALGDLLFVCTSNGVDESHINLPAPQAPSFMAMDKTTGKVYWTDNSPGVNIHHGQWSSPTVAVLGGVPQVLFGGGDGYLYSFRADQGKDGKPEFLWKFDSNPKEAKLILGGRGTRNDIIGTPVVYDGLVYVAVGQDPEHGEGIGHLWCIDPTKRGDVSPQLAVRVDDRTKPIPHRREQAVIPEKGEVAIDNPNSAVIWHYSEFDQNGDGTIDFEETMHRTCSTVAIKNDLLFIVDFSGLFHCVDAKTGKVHWTHDMLAAAWGSALIVGEHVYIGDEDGDVCIFNLSSEKHEPIAEINMGNSVYSTPIVANNTLFIANKSHLFAIQASDQTSE